jgi:hypothetical protein
MTASPWPVLRAEWLKRRRSMAGWLILGGGLFTPLIIFAVRLRQSRGLPALYGSGTFWQKHWTESWESISILILPVMCVLITALVAQIEFRNQTWKQVHAAPQSTATLFFAKLAVVLAMLVQLFVVLNLGIWLSGVMPVLLFGHVHAPAEPLPVGRFLARSLSFFIDCLPVVALQYALALRFRNFMVPVGAGMAMWIFALGTLGNRVTYLVPFSYPGRDYLVDAGYQGGHGLPVALQTLALGTFVLFTLAGYAMFAGKKDRGS